MCAGNSTGFSRCPRLAPRQEPSRHSHSPLSSDRSEQVRRRIDVCSTLRGDETSAPFPAPLTTLRRRIHRRRQCEAGAYAGNCASCSIQTSWSICSAANKNWRGSLVASHKTARPNSDGYVIGELKVSEVTPQMILREIDAAFMDDENDEWVRRLYEFLNGQAALKWQVEKLPLIRLEDGTHVQAVHGWSAPSFLLRAHFRRTSRRSVLLYAIRSTPASFLLSLGLTEPDPVDDVIRNILPKYSEDASEIPGAVYESDIRRFINVYKTDSRLQRDKLVETLRRNAVRLGCGHRHRVPMSCPTRRPLLAERATEESVCRNRGCQARGRWLRRSSW